MEAFSRGYSKTWRSSRLRLPMTVRNVKVAFSTTYDESTPVSSPIQPVAVVNRSHDNIDIEQFRQLAFEPEKPLHMKGNRGDPKLEILPAVERWFQPLKDDNIRPPRMTVAKHLESFSMTMLPYELMYPQHHMPHGEVVSQFISSLRLNKSLGTSTIEEVLGDHLENQLLNGADQHQKLDQQQQQQQQKLLRFYAPLALFSAALKFNHQIDPKSNPEPNSPLVTHNPLRSLYVAQAPISDLPDKLQKDLPTPNIIKQAGKGDVYDSSIWLGLEPTYTPLHRDPNPNIFVQLCSTKAVRLLPPASGDRVFQRVQQSLGKSSGNSRIRGVEMMEGQERQAFYEAIWKVESGGPVSNPGDGMPSLKIQEAILEPGDALYIPKGWWHSVRSLFSDGRLNGSVNWWFR